MGADSRGAGGVRRDADIAIFYGIVIQMYWRDHGPPHFHAYYQVTKR
jgi:hypothetical protein